MEALMNRMREEEKQIVYMNLRGTTIFVGSTNQNRVLERKAVLGAGVAWVKIWTHWPCRDIRMDPWSCLVGKEVKLGWACGFGIPQLRDVSQSGWGNELLSDASSWPRANAWGRPRAGGQEKGGEVSRGQGSQGQEEDEDSTMSQRLRGQISRSWNQTLLRIKHGWELRKAIKVG